MRRRICLVFTLIMICALPGCGNSKTDSLESTESMDEVMQSGDAIAVEQSTRYEDEEGQWTIKDNDGNPVVTVVPTGDYEVYNTSDFSCDIVKGNQKAIATVHRNSGMDYSAAMEYWEEYTQIDPSAEVDIKEEKETEDGVHYTCLTIQKEEKEKYYCVVEAGKNSVEITFPEEPDSDLTDKIVSFLVIPENET